MDLIIKQSCPSCGASIELHEADRLIRCSFCDVQNFMVAGEPLRFVLPARLPAEISPQEVLYIPYLRFKGQLFFCLTRDLGYKIVDTTHIGKSQHELPPSLGLRPQAMKLQPVTHRLSGKFVKRNEKALAIFEKAAKISEIGHKHKKDTLVHRSFIGETLSIIYLPVYVRDDHLVDGVLNDVVGGPEMVTKIQQNSCLFHERWVPKFISTICPNCADALRGEPDSVVLSCHNCHSSFQEQNGRFVKVDWKIIGEGNGQGAYLPFWKLHVEFDGVQLDNFADLLHLTNQPVVMTSRYSDKKLCFIVPAFKIRPKTFLRIAQAITLSQWDLGAGISEMVSDMYPVTLPASEAEQAIKIVLAAMAINKKELLPQLPDIAYTTQKAELLYLCFADHGHDLICEQINVAVNSHVLRFGRTL